MRYFNMKRTLRSVLSVEQLERRETPATLVSPTKLTYQDVDGDSVAVLFSKPVLNAANVNNVFQFNSGAGAVNGNNSAKEQLLKINLTAATNTAGTAVSVTSTPANGGDGFANVGFVNSTNQALGAVTIDGELGQLDAGDQSAVNAVAVASITVRSWGRFGLST